jgi:hypothetical protein
MIGEGCDCPTWPFDNELLRHDHGWIGSAPEFVPSSLLPYSARGAGASPLLLTVRAKGYNPISLGVDSAGISDGQLVGGTACCWAWATSAAITSAPAAWIGRGTWSVPQV